MNLLLWITIGYFLSELKDLFQKNNTLEFIAISDPLRPLFIRAA